jgi:hypothetical protein
MQPAVTASTDFGVLHKLDGIGDEKAADKYCHISFHQVSWLSFTPSINLNMYSPLTHLTKKTTIIGDGDGLVKHIRKLTIGCPFNGYGDISHLFGTEYTVVLWHDPSTPIGSVRVSSSSAKVASRIDLDKRATVSQVPVSEAHAGQGVTIEVAYDG